MPAAAWAQNVSEQGASSAGDNVIIVTARKRAESDLEVPVAIQAISTAQLNNKGIQSLFDVAATVPSLNIAVATGNSGGTITLRGIGTPPQGAGTEQAVAMNFDGVTVADGLAVRLGQFDLAQIEVLQGPQSLYFGKNSSGGIISVTTADPTDRLYAMLRGGYEFSAREKLTEAVISGPLAEGLGARLAFYRSDMEGYFKNPLASQTGTPSPAQLAIWGPLPRAAGKRAPEQTMTGFRGTLKYDSDALTARVKGTYVKQDGGDTFAAAQLFGCPSGSPSLFNLSQVAGIGDCKLNHFASPIGQNVNSTVGGHPLYRDGQPYADTEQYLISGSIDYRPIDGLTISSVTGYYDVHLLAAEVVTSSVYPAIGSTVDYGRSEFTQELRLTTDFDSALNAMAGVYYQSGDIDGNVTANVYGFTVPTTPIYYVDTETRAVFGQLTLDLMDKKFQIAAGGRYTDEKKQLRVFSRLDNAFIEDQLRTDRIRSKKFSPEISVSWRPDARTNVFASYKKGTKSGAFSLATFLPPPYGAVDPPLDFADETAEGFEGGVKTVLADGQLRFDLTGYRYTYKDLQVTVYNPETATTGTENAAGLKIYGVQLNTNFTPRSIPNLSLGASVNYGHARFSDYIAGCFVGQTIAEGCNINLNPVTGAFTNQNLGGTQPVAAPDWTGNVNASYDFPVGSSGVRFGLSASALYSSSYEVTTAQVTGSRQKAYANLDVTLRLFSDDDRWELALIGKNLTDQLRVKFAAEAPGTPSLGTVDPRTGTSGPTIRGDILGGTNAPRTVMLRLTFKPWGSN